MTEIRKFCSSACEKCQESYRTKMPDGKWYMRVMATCSICGNKRCPRAYDHNDRCSGSNDPDHPMNKRAWEESMREVRTFK